MKIGLMLATGEHGGPGRAPTWPELRAIAVAADECGLDSVWAADHFFHRRDDGRIIGIHEPWTLLTAIAASTSRVELGPLVLAVPFRNPGLVAKMAATLDEVSGGRLILGLGCGWHRPEFDAFGYPFDHRVAAFEEALQIIVPLLREGRVTFRGRYHAAVDAELRPRGPRPEGPPLLIAGKRPRMLRLVARHADAWNAAWYAAPETATELDERLGNLGAALEAEGRDPSTLEITVGLDVAFPSLLRRGESVDEEAISGDADEVAAAMARYAARGVRHLICHVWPRTPDAVRELGRAAEAARFSLSVALIGAPSAAS
jgi:probable F420-dependent oxidoreductase